MNRTSWIFIGTALLILAISGFFLFRPITLSDWQTYRATKSAEKELEEISKKKEVLTNLAKDNQLKNLREIAAKYIPEEAKSSELILELTAMAEQNKLQIEQVSLESKKPTDKKDEDTSASSTSSTTSSPSSSTSSSNQPAAPGGSQEISFTLKVRGTFGDFIGFLKSAETASRLVAIKGLTLAYDDKGFSAQVSGKSYWKQSETKEKTLVNISVTKETIEKFQNLKTYSLPINLTHEEGFGRTDPFANTQ